MDFTTDLDGFDWILNTLAYGGFSLAMVGAGYLYKKIEKSLGQFVAIAQEIRPLVPGTVGDKLERFLEVVDALEELLEKQPSLNANYTQILGESWQMLSDRKVTPIEAIQLSEFARRIFDPVASIQRRKVEGISAKVSGAVSHAAGVTAQVIPAKEAK